MYNNFGDYWEERCEILERLSVTKEVAHMIWCDAVDCLNKQLLEKLKK